MKYAVKSLFIPSGREDLIRIVPSKEAGRELIDLLTRFDKECECSNQYCYWLERI